MRAILALMVSLMALQATAQEAPFALETIAEGLTAPIYAIAPEGDSRLFVVEQSGTIRILADGELLPQPFLDVSDAISFGGEQGLLGLAFHPDFAANGRFFVNYTNTMGNTRVAGYTVSEDPNVAEPSSATDLLRVAQPYGNHNGGWIDFGPDGLLYVGMGDGGAGGDPQGYGQDPSSPLGKILRLDVDAGGTPEIFASGVRNPWRNAFDGDLLYIADVGQSAWEEVHVVSIGDAGANLGWNRMEGLVCFRGQDCDQTGLTLPVHVYDHGEGCSITGGFVYRGSAIPALEGRYLFGDYCSGTLWSFRYADGTAEDVTDYFNSLGNVGNITSFGRDGMGELYLTLADGRVQKLVAP